MSDSASRSSYARCSKRDSRRHKHIENWDASQSRTGTEEMERYRAASRERAEAVAAAAAAGEALNEPAAPKELSEAMKEDNVDPPAAEESSNPPGYVARDEEVPPSDNAPGNDKNLISSISHFSAGAASPSTYNNNNSGE
jgi:hypothetical protein